MRTEVSATLIDGVFKPDEIIPLPDRTRVRLTVEPIKEQREGTEAWRALKERLRQRPIHAAGFHYTREELHERC